MFIQNSVASENGLVLLILAIRFISTLCGQTPNADEKAAGGPFKVGSEPKLIGPSADMGSSSNSFADNHTIQSTDQEDLNEAYEFLVKDWEIVPDFKNVSPSPKTADPIEIEKQQIAQIAQATKGTSPIEKSEEKFDEKGKKRSKSPSLFCNMAKLIMSNSKAKIQRSKSISSEKHLLEDTDKIETPNSSTALRRINSTESVGTKSAERGHRLKNGVQAIKRWIDDSSCFRH